MWNITLASASQTSPLSTQLAQLKASEEKIHLIIDRILEGDELTQLENFIKHQNPLPFAKISLKADLTTLKNEKFLALLEQLGRTSVSTGELLIAETEIMHASQSICDALKTQVAPHVFFPLKVRMLTEQGPVASGLDLQDYQNILVTNIQKRNITPNLADRETVTMQQGTIDQPQQMAKKIKLKAIIRYKNVREENISQFIPLEMQLVDTVEQQIMQENVAEIAEVQTNLALHEIQEYNGPLLGFQDFSAPYYKNQVIQHTGDPEVAKNLYTTLAQELFANIPHAIKYITPEAAEYLAKNLPAFVTLNKDNLPNFLLLKQTIAGEFVLDFDAFLENEQTNPFTPRPTELEEYDVYNVLFDEQQPLPLALIESTKANIQKYFSETLAKTASDRISPKLTNMWVSSGAAGIESFICRLAQAMHNARPEAFVLTIFVNYLDHFPQWHYLNNESFFDCVTKISQYDTEKFHCLSKFLKNTGSSRHNLNQTVTAFEVFWSEVSVLCSAQNVSIAEINNAGDWSTPTGGNPVVYMERMLHILQKARSLDDQFKLLNSLVLDNYGAYYASRYEGFTAVATEMGLRHDVARGNTKQFNKNLKLYHVDLQQYANFYLEAEQYYYAILPPGKGNWLPNMWLIECSNPLAQPPLNLPQLQAAGLAISFRGERNVFVPPYHLYRCNDDGRLELLFTKEPRILSDEQYISACYRFIGMQTAGISVSALKKQFIAYRGNILFSSNLLTAEYLTSLFFVSHARFVEHYSLKPLFRLINRAAPELKLFQALLTQIMALYTLDIKLNQVEAEFIFQTISPMNSFEFEDLTRKGLCEKKEVCVNKFFACYKQNKFAMNKLLDFFLKKTDGKWPTLYAIDTADYLAQDPIIAATYYDDLLLFAGLINSLGNEAYFHARVEGDKAQADPVALKIRSNMQQVQAYLREAATQEKPNNLHYAIQIMLNAKTFFTFEQFLNACAEINVLPAFDHQAVDAILLRHRFTVVAKELPPLLARDSADLKAIIIAAILLLEAVPRLFQPNQAKLLSLEETTPVAGEQEMTGVLALRTQESSDQDLPGMELPENLLRSMALASLTLPELQTELEILWQKSGTLLSFAGKIFLKRILAMLLEVKIKSAFGLPNAHPLLITIAEKISALPDFQEYDTFEKVEWIATQIEKIAQLFQEILTNPVVAKDAAFAELFAKVNFSTFDYETLFSLVTLLVDMPQRNYLTLLNVIFSEQKFLRNKSQVMQLLTQLTNLNNDYFPSEYLETFTQLVVDNPEADDFYLITQKMIGVFSKDIHDPVLKLLMWPKKFTYSQVRALLDLSERAENNRDKLATFLNYLQQRKTLDPILDRLNTLDEIKQQTVVEILCASHALNPMQGDEIEYHTLVDLLDQLSEEDLTALRTFYHTTPVSAQRLLPALQTRSLTTNFEAFLLLFEKSPFGVRDFNAQFSLAEVERVVNESWDLLNGSIYPYQYRKQLMESFLFINEIGNTLPAYHGKSAKELTNKEIKSFFAEIKAKNITGLTSFQAHLLALGLMREAMYRSTGQFPYSTQMIALIDGMMHQSDFITNINTGEGKSLIDLMKAALLWLDSDRVDLTTSSLVDAKRDIANYGPFLQLLGIPYAQTPISSLSNLEDFQCDGINFSTFAQLALFFSRAKFTRTVIDTPDTVVSLVVNESDHAILDDRVIYRFATATNVGIGYGHEWIYYAINEFVAQRSFIANEDSGAEDIVALKMYLSAKARSLKKSAKIIDKFSEQQYWSWLESALIVNYVLKENVHFVIPDAFEEEVINGTSIRSRVVKILLKDNKVSPDSTFGNGIQQLLYARLNKDRECTDFVIKPQNQTLISTNNTNLINYYRARQGFIWGSSGTVGSQTEINEQYQKYGFEFSQSVPHKMNRVRFNPCQLAENETTQFAQLITQLLQGTPSETRPPALVFCKDIPTAQRLYAQLKDRNAQFFPIQLYTGLGDEESHIRSAGKPSMITITTSALGRNTDIPYDRVQGLHVWHTFVDSVRGTGQMSGRTGRQGSAGVVNFLLNKEELNGRTIETIQETIDAMGAKERRINEALYNVFGYLLTTIDQFEMEERTKFLRETWPEFCTRVEAEFNESTHQGTYDEGIFRQRTLDLFNQLTNTLSTSVPAVSFEMLQQHIAHTYLQKEHYHPDVKPVRIEACTPPLAIAYHILPYDLPQNDDAAAIKENVKAKITELFNHKNGNTVNVKNNDFLLYLFAAPVDQKTIATAYQEFLADYLHNTQKLNFMQRWLGYQSTLNQVTSNRNYLLLFHTFAQLKPEISLQATQHAVNGLVEEYLATSWFISPERKQWAAALQSEIANATDVEAVIACLAQAQEEVAEKDIQTNKTRVFKSLHFFGYSRYQSTLSKALNLTAALQGKTDVGDSTNQLTATMVKVTDEAPITDLTWDVLAHKASGKKIDRSNAAVIINTLENRLAIKDREGPSGMKGRDFFAHLRTIPLLDDAEEAQANVARNE